MSMVRGVVGMPLVVLVVACGRATPPAPANPISIAAPAEAPPPELTAVAASPELFAVARVANPSKLADLAIAWSALPVNWRSMLATQAPGIDSAASYDAPVDFAAMLDPASGEEPRVFWAVSYGAPSVDVVANFLRKQGGALTPIAGGGYLARVDSHAICVVARALGPTKARVVCSDESEGAQALAPYMAQGLPTESLGAAEVHAHVLAEPFRRRYGSQLALVRTVGVPFALRELEVDHPKFDRALRDVLYGLADEVVALAYDVDRIDLDVAVGPEPDMVSLNTSLGLTGKRSWWAQAVAAAAEHPGVAPDEFWKFPRDATSGSFGAHADPERIRGVVSGLRELLDGWLDYQALPDRLRAPLVDAFEQAFTGSSARSSYVTLPVPLAAIGPSVPNGKDTAALREREQARVGLGAHLFAVDQGGDKFSRLLSEAVKALGDRTFREHLSKSKLLAGVALPSARERAPRAVKGLPAGSKVFELEIPGSAFSHSPSHSDSWADSDSPGKKKTAGKPKTTKPVGEPLTVLVVAVPDGPLTWFGFGTDEKLLESRIATARAGGAPTLAEREGLGSLRTEPTLYSGFSTLSALLGRVGSPFTGGKSGGETAALERLPHRGETPMIWRTAVDPRGPKFSVGMRVPKAVVEDIVAFAVSHGPLRP